MNKIRKINNIDNVTEPGIYIEDKKHHLDNNNKIVIFHKSGCKIICTNDVILIEYNNYKLEYKNDIFYVRQEITDENEDDEDDEDDEGEGFEERYIDKLISMRANENKCDCGDDKQIYELIYYNKNKFQLKSNDFECDVDMNDNKINLNNCKDIDLYIVVLLMIKTQAQKFLDIKIPIKLSFIKKILCDISLELSKDDDKTVVKYIETDKKSIKRSKNDNNKSKMSNTSKKSKTENEVKYEIGNLPIQLKLLHNMVFNSNKKYNEFVNIWG